MTSAEGATRESAPCFVVPAGSSDEFVDARARREHGAQSDGSPHDWQAFDIDGAEVGKCQES
ncbi:MAG: hypothetical protein M3348_19430 [Acidobacteriota bacterium]|nr:hypothetical protein [Acidobacteriota bacterium]